VADTVGGDGLLTLMEQGRAPGESRPGWTPRPSPSREGPPPALAYESRNVPDVMTPWELRDHLGFLMSEVPPGQTQAAAIGQALNRLRANWHALWARSGDEVEARPEYAALLNQAWPRLEALGVHAVPLRNGMSLGRCLKALVFESALGGASRAMDAESRAAPVLRAAAQTAPQAATPRVRDPVFARPIFVVSPPRSGSTLLFETLATAPGLFTIGGESHRLMESLPEISPAGRDWASNRLAAGDTSQETVAALRERFRGALRDRDGTPPIALPVRMLEKTPKNALRIPFLAEAFPEAVFVYLHRDPGPSLASMIEGWRSGGFRTYPGLPGWTGPDWSFVLTPGWRTLIGARLEQVVARQWADTTRILLDDLESLPAERRRAVRYEAFLAAPQAEIARLCHSLDVAWDRRLGDRLPLARHTLTPPDRDKWRAHAAAIEATAAIWSPENERALAFLRQG
jgi:hypothetical protein